MSKISLYVFALLFITCITTDAYALTVSPAKLEVTVDPGQTVQGEIEIFNEQEETKTFYTSYENFESRGDSGAPYFVGAQNGLATWISTEPQVTLKPGERVPVVYTISVPANTKPGGYFAAVFFGSQPAKGSGAGEVNIGGKIGVLILLKVSGQVEESAGLTNFGALNTDRIFSASPITFEFGFNNTGGDRVVPKGEIKIKNTLRFTSATLIANENEGSVLPNSTRRFEVVWDEDTSKPNEEKRGFFGTAIAQLKDFHFGWYTAYIHVAWGASVQTATEKYHFLIIPWQLIIIVVGLYVIIRFIFRMWVRRLKQKIREEAMQNIQ